MLIYRVSDGALIADFGRQEVYTKFISSSAAQEDDESEAREARYIVSLSECRSQLFSLMRDENLVKSYGLN